MLMMIVIRLQCMVTRGVEQQDAASLPETCYVGPCVVQGREHV